jgi:hypothetical protein
MLKKHNNQQILIVLAVAMLVLVMGVASLEC